MTIFTPKPGGARRISVSLRDWACETDDDVRLSAVTVGDIARIKNLASTEHRYKPTASPVRDEIALHAWWSKRVYDLMDRLDFCPASSGTLANRVRPMPEICIISDITDAWGKTLA